MGDFLKKKSTVRTEFFNRASTISLSKGDMVKLSDWLVRNDAVLNKKASTLLADFVRNLPLLADGEKISPAERQWVRTEIHSRNRVAVVNPAQLEEAILKEHNDVKWVKENNVPVVIVTTPVAVEKYVVPCFPVPLHVPEPMKPGQFRLIAALSGMCKMGPTGMTRSLSEAIATNCSLTSRVNLDGLTDMIDYLNSCVEKYKIKVKTTLGSGKTISALKELIQLMNEEEYYVLVGLYAHKVLKLDITVIQSKVTISDIFAATQYQVSAGVKRVLQEHSIYPPLLPSVVPAPIRLPALTDLKSLAKLLSIPTTLTDTPLMAKSVPYVGCPSDNFKKIYETVAIAKQFNNPVISHVTTFEMPYLEASIPTVRYIRSNVKSTRLIESLADGDVLIEREQIGLADISILKEKLVKIRQSGVQFVWIGTFYPQFHEVQGITYYSFRPIYDSRMLATNQNIKKFGSRSLTEITAVNYGQQLAGSIKFFAESILMPRVGTDIELMNNVRPPIATKPMIRLDGATEEIFEVIQDTVVGSAVLDKAQGYTYAREEVVQQQTVVPKPVKEEEDDEGLLDEELDDYEEEEDVLDGYYTCATNHHTFVIGAKAGDYTVHEVCPDGPAVEKEVSSIFDTGIKVAMGGRKHLTLLYDKMEGIDDAQYNSHFEEKTDKGEKGPEKYEEVQPLKFTDL